MGENLIPQFPLYIPSKGRSGYMVTSKYLTYMGVRHYIVVEPSELDDYKEAIKSMDLLATAVELDLSYKERYELCDNYGLAKSTGPGPARNFAWDHSKSNGHNWHWVIDDNIRAFKRLNKNEKVKVASGSFFKAMEDFCLRYVNVSMAGPNYMAFAPARTKMPPFITNTRIYSCNFIRNDAPFRWRGRYNEDTILSLDMLKARWCTIQFNAFLQDKMQTQAMAGGNTSEFYHADDKPQEGQKYSKTGTIDKSRMMLTEHPDVSRVVYKFGRIHHSVDYRPFKRNKLIRRQGIEMPSGINNYEMALKKKSPA
jgi:hypothetical protein